MRFEYKPSFDKTFKKLPKERKNKVLKAIFALIDYFETGKRVKGLGLKHLRGDFWEIRANIKDRIIFAFIDDIVSFVIVGTHDEIRRFLRNL